MNKEELALHFIQEYYNIPKKWEDYIVIKNALKKNIRIKQALNDIKTYIEEHETNYNNDWYFEDFTSTNKLLEIVDKAIAELQEIENEDNIGSLEINDEDIGE